MTPDFSMDSAKPVDLLFLNGWSLDASFVDHFVCSLAEHRSYRVVDIDETFLSDVWLERIAAYVHNDTFILGWSLGGMLAFKLAYSLEKNKRQYGRLITLMAAPSFVARDTWPNGMEQHKFALFEQAVEDDERLVKTFAFLMTPSSGEDHERAQLQDSGRRLDRQFLASLKRNYRACLQSSARRKVTLGFLGELDLTEELASLSGPVTMVFTERDQLVSLPSAQAVQQRYSQHEVCVIEREGHFLSDAVMSYTKEVLGVSEGGADHG